MLEQDLIAGHDDPVRTVEACFLVGRVVVIDRDGGEADLVGDAVDHRVEVEVAVRDVHGDGAVRLEVALVVVEGLEGQEVHRDGVAAEGVQHDDVVLLVRFAFHREAGVAHHELRLGLRILQVGEGARREPGHVVVDLVEAEGVARAAPGGEGAAAEADGADASSAAGLVRAEEAADAAGRRIVAARVGALLGVDVLQAVDGRAVLQGQVVRAGDFGVVVIDLEHAVETAGHAQRAAERGRGDVGEAVAQRGEREERQRPGPAAPAFAEGEGRILTKHEEHERGGQEQREVQFEVIGEDEGRDQRDEQSAGGPARGEREVEAGQTARAGTQAVDFAVADHAGDEQRAEIERGERGDVGVGFRLIEVPEHHAQQDGEQREPEGPMIPARAVEADDERKQIEAQRQDPEERHYGDVLAELVGDREEQHDAAGGQGEPQQLPPRRGGGFDLRSLGRCAVRRGGFPDLEAAPRRESGIDRQTPRPTVGLRLAAQLGFEVERVDQQGEQ